MAFERKLAAVPPHAFTANGTPQGVITVISTAGFYIKQFVNLQSDTLQSAGFQVKNVLSNTQLLIGLPNNSLRAPQHPLDLSGYLVADAATIAAPEQDNFPIKPDDHYLSVYLPAPVSADRVIPVDPYGNFYTSCNTFPVNVIPQTGIPFTLGILALPNLIQKYTSGLTYNQVVSETVDGEEILTFNEGSTFVGELTLTKTDIGWILNVGVPEDNFLLLENGDIFLLEDGDGLLLE